MDNSARETAIQRLFLAAFVAVQLASFAPVVSVSDKTWALLLLAFSLISSGFVLVVVRPLSIRWKIAALAICYIGLSVGFASLHYLLFLEDPASYIFADAISETQARLTIMDARQEAALASMYEQIVAEIAVQPDGAIEALRRGQPLRLPSGASAEIDVTTYVTAPGGTVTTHSIAITSAAGGQFSLEGDIIGDPRSNPVYDATLAKSVGEIRSALTKLRVVLAKQHDDAMAIYRHSLPVWRYSDFMYFSAVTISTVGGAGLQA